MTFLDVNWLQFDGLNGFLVVRLKLSFRKFYHHHHDLVDCYGISVTNDWIFFVCRNHNPVISSYVFLTYHRVCNKSNTMGAICEAGTPYHSGGHEFTPGFWWVLVARSLLFCIMFCVSLFVVFILVIVLPVLRFAFSDYSFGIFTFS